MLRTSVYLVQKSHLVLFGLSLYRLETSLIIGYNLLIKCSQDFQFEGWFSLIDLQRHLFGLSNPYGDYDCKIS